MRYEKLIPSALRILQLLPEKNGQGLTKIIAIVINFLKDFHLR